MQVAILDATPEGIHTAEKVLCCMMEELHHPQIRVDIIDRRPSAAGLIRVNPRGSLNALDDHTTAHLRFIGNVRVGTDFPVEYLRHHYDLVATSPSDLTPEILAAYSERRGVDKPDLVADLRAAGLAVTTWHGWHRLDESVRRGLGGWRHSVAAAHGIPIMP